MTISYLFLPAQKIDTLIPLQNEDIDVCVIDLEDSVHINAKHQARNLVRKFKFDALKNKNFTLGIRINSIHNIHGIDDIKLLSELADNSMIANVAIFIPKLRDKNELKLYTELLRSILPNCKIIPIIETTEAIQNVEAIAALSDEIILGQADLCAELYSPNPAYLAYSRAMFCAAAAKNNILAIDTNSFSLDNPGQLLKECLAAKAEGFMAKAIIHPKQAKAVKHVFSVTEDQITQYETLIDKYLRSQVGFAIEDGKVIAPPFVAKARKLVNFYTKYQENKRLS